MRNKGFTLIELLAVIVILAIIALIAVPIVLNLINNSKEQAVKVSAEHYFDAVEQAIAREYLKDATINLDGEYEIIEDGKKIKLGEREINVEYDGEGLKEGTIVIGSGKVKQAQGVKINNYYVILESGKITLTKNQSSNENGNDEQKPGSGETQLAAGLYDGNDNLITSWEELISNGTINVSNGGTTINYGTNTSISGKLVISDNITSIGYQSFYSCTNLTEVIIPDSVINIDFDAFYHCTGLTKIILGNGIKSIGNSVFSSCTGLTEITIPNSVTSIGDNVFANTSLTSVMIPSSVTSIGSGVFNRAKNLQEINVEVGNVNYCSENGILYNKDKTTLVQYPNGKTESSFTIPSSVTSIGASAFNNCTNLTKVEIPSSVTSIGSDSFCFSGLTEITIPNSVTSIGGGAFYECTSLPYIEIPSSVTSIGDWAFSYIGTVYYSGSASGSPWGAGQVLPLQ